MGIDGSSRGDDALAFGAALAEALDTGVLLAHAYGPGEDRGHARAILDERRDMVRTVPLESVAHADPSPARALHRVAAARHTALIVVGPSHRAGLGLVVPGSTGQQLLQQATAAVAIVPRGWHAPAEASLRHIGCGYDGSPEAEAALATASELTRALGAELDVMRAVSGAPPGPALIARSTELDVLVLGSRGKGPLGAVWAGSVSARVIREASCPVIVVPRGARPALAPATQPA